MSDLIERLREFAWNDFNAPGERRAMIEAADEIERRDKVIEILRDEAIDWHDISGVNKALADYDKGESDE